ncbi:hypothetical protein C0076_04060 [Klebsiella pneumoniae]|nr:hypothetical protein C0076_04060 [Klebsiella pneumoniae]
MPPSGTIAGMEPDRPAALRLPVLGWGPAGRNAAAGQLVQANSLSSPSGAGPDPAGRDRNSSAPAGSDPDTRPDSA